MGKTAKNISYGEISADFLAEFQDCLWGGENCDRFHYTTLDDAITDAVEGMPSTPDTVEIFAMRRITVDPGFVSAVGVIDHILENLDDEYGDPDCASDPTDAMRLAAENLCAVVLREYVPYTMEKVLAVRVNTADWIKANRSQCLEKQG